MKIKKGFAETACPRARKRLLRIAALCPKSTTPKLMGVLLISPRYIYIELSQQFKFAG
jgi:hypothetical protein